jgi:hypothetical protein
MMSDDFMTTPFGWDGLEHRLSRSSRAKAPVKTGHT